MKNLKKWSLNVIRFFTRFLGKDLVISKTLCRKVKNEILNQNPDFPPQIVTLFSKVKFYSRIKVLNVNLKLNRMKNSVRSLKQMGQFIN